MIFNELKQHGTDDFPFELYQVSALHPKYEMAFHWHTNLELIRVLDGELLLTLDNRATLLRAGDVAFINSETVHGATPRECRYDCIVFNLAFLKTGNAACDAFLDSLLSHTAFLHEFPKDETVKQCVHAVFDEIAAADDEPPFKTIGLFHTLLGEIRKKELFISHLPPANGQDGKKVNKLKSVLAYIRENFAKDITLEDMALIAGFSEKYFCKFFKDMTGTTPVQYLLTYRIERAARKLLGSDLSVTQIAYDCGFNDLSYFIKTFKTFKGVSPKDYRTR
ncbi:MAG: helix-turn-helix domain-containing protein [Clostridiales bacterium]|nr:helix-turn-helix domain-containing protein [Clostridiales bacterium]MBQ2769555.1 helix-turn-helix transcriptional regulator [Clostridia bacterium]